LEAGGKTFFWRAPNFLEAGEQLFFDAHQTFWKLARKPFF
jgi:hypothetical protein